MSARQQRMERNRKNKIMTFTMQTNTVVKTVFSFLSLDEIKTCRYVCNNWKAIADPILRKRSKITFHNKAGRTPADFSSTFGFPYVTMKFSSFIFSRGYWPLAVVEEFMKEQQKNVVELELNNITLLKDSVKIKNPCLSDWLAKLPLKKLSILCSKPSPSLSRDWDCNPVVTLDALKHVPEIILDSCKIKLKNGDKITPTSIKLNFVAIHNEDGRILNEFCVNDLINLKRINTIDITCPKVISHNCGGTKLSLKLEKCPKLTELKLTETVVEKWGMAKSNFDSLYLDGVPFFGNTRTVMKQFSYQCAAINLADISPQVEEIYLYSYSNSTTVIFTTQPVVFPNLRSLHLFGGIADRLQHFENSSNLVELYIGGHRDSILKLSWLPDSVKRIHFGILKGVINDRVNKLEIDLLILDGYSSVEAREVLQQIRPKTLLMERQFNPDECHKQVIPFIHQFRDVPNMYLGPLQDEIEVTCWERLTVFVQKRLTYLFFENLNGRAISKEDFDSHKITTPL